MSRNPALRDRAIYTYWARDTVRFSDTDAAGHVNNVAICAWLETGRLTFIRHIGLMERKPPLRGISAGLNVSFLRESHWPGEVDIGCGILEIGRSIAAIAKGARDRTIARENLMGSTFTISNVGSHAGRFATPVINYPEAGILAVGRAREGMVTRNGWFRIGNLLPLSLACDHRVVDGATAALALAEIIKLLHEPQQLLTPARR